MDPRQLGPVCKAMAQRERFSFNLAQYTTVFQADVYAIKACAVDSINRNY
jgi:hypothetical protein